MSVVVYSTGDIELLVYFYRWPTKSSLHLCDSLDH